MKFDFAPPTDGQAHRYCWHCRAEAVRHVTVGEQRLHHCTTCGQTLPRALIIDPAVHWWLDESGEYWHETAGVFVCNPDRQFLFFKRTAHPFGLTPPAGHIAPNESVTAAARRELYEEVGLRTSTLIHIGTNDIPGDKCSRGADAHRWQTFGLVVPTATTINLNEEGLQPVWLNLAEAKARDLTFATRFVIARHGEALSRLI